MAEMSGGPLVGNVREKGSKPQVSKLSQKKLRKVEFLARQSLREKRISLVEKSVTSVPIRVAPPPSPVLLSCDNVTGIAEAPANGASPIDSTDGPSPRSVHIPTTIAKSNTMGQPLESVTLSLSRIQLALQEEPAAGMDSETGHQKVVEDVLPKKLRVSHRNKHNSKKQALCMVSGSALSMDEINSMSPHSVFFWSHSPEQGLFSISHISGVVVWSISGSFAACVACVLADLCDPESDSSNGEDPELEWHFILECLQVVKEYGSPAMISPANLLTPARLKQVFWLLAWHLIEGTMLLSVNTTLSVARLSSLLFVNDSLAAKSYDPALVKIFGEPQSLLLHVLACLTKMLEFFYPPEHWASIPEEESGEVHACFSDAEDLDPSDEESWYSEDEQYGVDGEGLDDDCYA